ncbi:glycosyl hydrolase [Paenibacillus filicis]|uniref:Glycosyl hydrolase n=1 Tax=Paenibacillus gyeongsangnamensis TaxID=3388067 RepID=A0ABT4QAL9_9BACL|nr:glycosylhydrolase-like jelly roll fold domain-containing protein [Paenibacillus filicis]MCZ8513730.1 glycosyl hydrolase [Paenibacillus filicis]
MHESSLKQQFIHPANEFTPVPFWFWNDELTIEELIRQIADFEAKGVMGFVIHPRIGIPERLVYLSDDYMALVEAAVQEAADRGMTVILYDEDMYPSGSAKGLVMDGNPEYASRGLKLAKFDCDEPIALDSVLSPGDTFISAQAVRKDTDRLAEPSSSVILSPQDGIVTFQPPGAEKWTILLFIETYSRGTIRGIHFGEDDGEPHAPASADLLNPEAVRKFIRITHERYAQRLGRYFGTTIRAMFTDEPDILGRRHLKGLKPWTNDFLTCFIREGNEEKDLPLLWLEGEDASGVRMKYRKAVQKRLMAAYYRPLSEWCASHGIVLTGHPAGSDDIGLLEHFQIPGQDVVWRWVAPEDGKALEGKHSTAAKCSSDAARHRGRRRNLNEFLGVCSPGGGWALSAGDMKWYMDWLAVRGVNMLCPHAFYYSIDGPRRAGERPPDVGPNNIWWPHYRAFADYMKRMSWLMTDSRNVTPVAVVCKEDRLPWRIVKPLYEHQMEFNYLEESLLVSAAELENSTVRIADQRYSVLLVEDEEELEEATLQALSRFREHGGIVIGLQEEESYPEAFGAGADAGNPMLNALDRYLERDVLLEPPCKEIRVSHVVKDGHHFYVLVNEGEARYEGGVLTAVSGSVEQWDAWEGDIRQAEVYPKGEGTYVRIILERRQSVILHVDPKAEPILVPARSESSPVQALMLTDGWDIAASGFPIIPEGLGSWIAYPELKGVSGTAVYSCRFELETVEAGRPLTLDLGDVHEIAEVRINGQAAGVAMWHPYTVRIDHLVKQGANELSVAVTNSLANRMDGAALPSGLIGPVRLLEHS